MPQNQDFLTDRKNLQNFGTSKKVVIAHLIAVKSIMLITILFQEAIIFGANASLTYSPQIQRHTFV